MIRLLKKAFIVLPLPLLFISLLILNNSLPGKAAEQKPGTIFIIPVEGTIDLGLSAYIKRACRDAKKDHASVVVFKINTFGGRVDAADGIVTDISGLAPISTFAYITQSAWSAGALIAISCKQIVMNSGSSIGSAEPRLMGLGGMEESSDEKIISALRSRFKATAEANLHSVNLAQAMVDKDLEIHLLQTPTQFYILTSEELKKKKAELEKTSPPQKITDEKIISAKNKLLNLTAGEANELKLSSKTVNSEKEFIDYLKHRLNLPDNVQIRTSAPKWSENMVRFLTSPMVSPLLLSLGFLGLLFELKIPGWGISGTLGVIFLVLFFWGHYLAGLADWADIAIFILGIILLVVELIFIPGFGVTGFIGIVLIISGLFLTLLKHPFRYPSFELAGALQTLALTFVLTFFFLVAVLKFFPKTTLWKNIRLQANEDKELGFRSGTTPEDLKIGDCGQAKSMLRPAGRADFNNKTFNVITQGEFIAKGAEITIVKIEESKIFVEERRRA